MPDEMPHDGEIIFSDHIAHETVSIRRDSITYKSGTGWHNRRERTVKIADGDTEKIYTLLRQNNFDRMRNDSGKSDERINNSISVFSAEFNFTIYQGLLPLSAEDNERFENIKRSILTLADKYKETE